MPVGAPGKRRVGAPKSAKDGDRSRRPIAATDNLSATRLCGFLVSFVLCFALLHQVTVLAGHRVGHERLLAEFATTGVSVGRGQPNGEARARQDQREC